MRPSVVRAERESVGSTFPNVQEHAVVTQCPDTLIFSKRPNFATRILQVDQREYAAVVRIGCRRTNCVRSRRKCVALRDTFSSSICVSREEDRGIQGSRHEHVYHMRAQVAGRYEEVLSELALDR